MKSEILPSVIDLNSFCSYSLENGICYLVLCEKAFSKRLAFGYLDDIQTEFSKEYGEQVATATRPYSFIEFGMKNSMFYL